MKNKKYDLEDRLIDFGVLIIKIAEQIGNTIPGKHLGGNLIRSGTSPAFNYGEALPENEELISIFVKSIETAQTNLKSDEKNR